MKALFNFQGDFKISEMLWIFLKGKITHFLRPTVRRPGDSWHKKY